MRLLAAAVCAAMAVAASDAQAALVDLNTWAGAEGAGTWNISGDGNSVTQTLNTNPGVFHNGTDSQGQFLSGTIRVNTTSDDDFIGFVLGYNAGDISSNDADYLLIDWKQGTQSFFGCSGTAGLAISRVTGPLGNDSGAWCHDPANNVTELARAANLGSTGWADLTTYEFVLEFTASRVRVFVGGTEEIDITGSFTDGSFGFYNYSQANVTYAGLQQGTVIPLPAAAWLLLSGVGALGALAGLRRHRAG